MADLDPALIDKVAKAIFDTYGQRDTDRSRRLARAVLEAVAPAIAAQALRDAAEDIEGPDSDWLRERADRITKEEQ